MSLRLLTGRLRSLLGRTRRLRGFEADIEAHLSLLAQDLERQGLTPEAARREARLRFGGVEQVREAYRDASGFPLLDAIGQDVRYGARTIRRQPGFSLLIVALVGLGVGANTAIFSLVNAVLLRPLPYPNHERLVVVRSVVPPMARTYPTLPAAAGEYLLWRSRVPAFDAMAAVRPSTQTLTGRGDPVRVAVCRATASLLPMLGVRPVAGRVFREAEDQEGQNAVAMLGYGFWMERLGGDPSVIGQSVTLDDKSYTVVGVLPRDFRFPRANQLGSLISLPARVDILRSAAFTADDRDTLIGDFDWAVIARLAPGATKAQAESQLNAVQADIIRQIGEHVEFSATVIPLHEQVVGQARRGLLLLGWAVVTALLVIAVNLASLLLARVSARTHEAAIRVALGASRRRVMQQVVIENLALAAAGGALGIVVAWAGVQLLVARAPIDLPRIEDVGLDVRVLAFAVATSLLTGVLFSVLPAWRLARANPQEGLRAGGRGTSDAGSALSVRATLVTVEVALSTVLVTASTLLGLSFVRLVNVEAGFSSERVVFAAIAPSVTRYDETSARTDLDDRLLARLRELPDVSEASLVSEPPLGGEAHVRTVSIEHDTRPFDQRPVTNVRYVDPGYFRALGIQLKAGRTFDDRDRGQPVAVVNERMAAANWPGRHAIGLRFREGNERHPMLAVVGVVGDAREVSLYKSPYPMIYVPYWADGGGPAATLVIKTSRPADAIVPEIRRAIWSVDPTIPAPAVATFAESIDRIVAPDRFQMLLVLGFALSAVVLACLGIYGVPAFAVARRSRELAIRLALGAAPSTLVRMVVRQGLAPVAVGLVIGLAGAVVAGRLMESLLFETAGASPWMLLAIAAGIGSVAVVACIIPARRVMHIDAVQAIRSE
jgi:putative ABC transport system permease protein